MSDVAVPDRRVSCQIEYRAERAARSQAPLASSIARLFAKPPLMFDRPAHRHLERTGERRRASRRFLLQALRPSFMADSIAAFSRRSGMAADAFRAREVRFVPENGFCLHTSVNFA